MREVNEFAPTVQILVREAHFLQAAARRGESTRLAPCVPVTTKVRLATRLMLCRFSPLLRGLNVMREANEFAPTVHTPLCYVAQTRYRPRIWRLLPQDGVSVGVHRQGKPVGDAEVYCLRTLARGMCRCCSRLSSFMSSTTRSSPSMDRKMASSSAKLPSIIRTLSPA
jgi:hypothetical protein